jgi:WD40 repeat protein
MGRVFLGRSAGGRPVAVKVIRADLGADPEFRERFRREVAAAQKVNGLYTALVVDADLDGPTPWLATAYVPGPSLADAVGRHGPLPVTAVSVLAAGLAEGLAAIHAAGLVHGTGKLAKTLSAQDSGGSAGLAYSADGRTLIEAGNNGDIDLWSTASGKVTRTFANPDTQGAAAEALTHDGKALAVADNNGHIYLWSTGTGRIIATTGYRVPSNGVADLAFSPDGHTLAAAGEQGKIFLWKIR